MIQDWIKNGCNYQQGVDIFKKLSTNKVLISLFSQPESTYLNSKLKAELKLLISTEPRKEQRAKVVREESAKELKKVNTKPISFYPSALHAVYQRRIQTFLEASSLKMELNDLPDNADHNIAFALQIKIFNLFQQNDKCWSILNEYEKTKQILPFESDSDFSELSYRALCKLRENKWTSVWKRKKTIEAWELKIEELPDTKKFKKIEDIKAKKEELQRLYNDIEKLTELINKEE